MKAFITFFISLVLVIVPPVSYANTGGGWSVSRIATVGKTAFTEAINGNKKSTAKITPTIGMVGKVLRTLSGANALHTAITALLGGVDYVMGEGGAIHYKENADGYEYRIQGRSFDSAEDACDFIASQDFLSTWIGGGYVYGRLGPGYGDMRGKYYKAIEYDSTGYNFTCRISIDSKSNEASKDYRPNGEIRNFGGTKWAKGEIVEKTISLNAVAQQVLDQAQQGNQQAQEAVENAVKQAVKAGDFNAVLEQNAQAINDAKDGEDGKDGTDGKDAPPLDVSGIINAISSLADRMATFFGRLETKADSIISEVQLTTRVINTQTDEIIEQTKGVKVAVESLEMQGELINGNMEQVVQQGKLVNQKIDEVVLELENTRDITKIGLDAIRDAIQNGMSGELINHKIDEAIAESKRTGRDIQDTFRDVVERQTQQQARENEKTISAIKDVAKAIDTIQLAKDTDAYTATQAKVNTDRIVNAIENAKAKEKDETQPKEKEKDKPFELPAFCTWAKPVCDLIEWVKKDPEVQQENYDVGHGTLENTGLDNIDRYQMRIDFPNECPSQKIQLNLFGRTYSKDIPYQYLCQFLEMVSPLFIALSLLSIAFYVVREI